MGLSYLFLNCARSLHLMRGEVVYPILSFLFLSFRQDKHFAAHFFHCLGGFTLVVTSCGCRPPGLRR